METKRLKNDVTYSTAAPAAVKELLPMLDSARRQLGAKLTARRAGTKVPTSRGLPELAATKKETPK